MLEILDLFGRRKDRKYVVYLIIILIRLFFVNLRYLLCTFFYYIISFLEDAAVSKSEECKHKKTKCEVTHSDPAAEWHDSEIN